MPVGVERDKGKSEVMRERTRKDAPDHLDEEFSSIICTLGDDH